MAVRQATWLGLCALLLSATACVGAPTGESSWRESADHAIGQAISGLGTAQVVLGTDTDQGIPRSYAVVTLTDAAESVAKEMSGFFLLQPPDALHALSAGVVRALSQASRTLVLIRTEFASPDPGRTRTAGLLRLARAELKQLEALQKSVQESAQG